MRFLRFRSLRARMIVLFTLLATLLITFTQLVSYQQLRRVANDVGVSSMRNYIIQTMNSLDIYLGDIVNMSRNIMADEHVQHALQAEIRPGSLETLLMFRSLKDVYEKYSNTRTHIHKVYLENTFGVFLDSDYCEDSEAIRASDWYAGFESGANLSVAHSRIYSNTLLQVFTYRHPIYPISGQRKIIGYLLVDIDSAILKKVFVSEPPIEGSSLYLLNGHDECVFAQGFGKDAPPPEAVNHELLPDEEQYTVALPRGQQLALSNVSELSGWRLVLLVPTRELGRSQNEGLITVLAACLIALSVIAIAATILVRNSFRPVLQVTDAMARAAKGDLTVQVASSQEMETRALIDGFNSMVRHIRKLLQRVSEEERRKKDLEIYALKAQVSPHFLYNTLNSVRYLSRADRPRDVQQVILSLIHLLQASFERARFITMEREMNLVRDYLKIQQTRYELPIKVEELIQPDVLSCAIPGFTIQPIVENALFHGIVPQGGGSIRISACRQGGDVEVRIEDDGVGMEPEKVRELMSQRTDMEEPADQKTFTRIGIANVDGRIRHLYAREQGESGLYCDDSDAKERHCLTIESKPGAGTCVTLRIPFLSMAVGTEVEGDVEGTDRR